MAVSLVPPPTEPAADLVFAALSPLAEVGQLLADALGGPGRLLRGGTPRTTEADRATAPAPLRLAVRVANRPDLPGYAGAPPGGDRAGSTSRQRARVELLAVGPDVAGVRDRVGRALRVALAALLDDGLDLGDIADDAWGDSPDVAVLGRIHLTSGPTAALFDGVDRDWTASAVVEVALRTLERATLPAAVAPAS